MKLFISIQERNNLIIYKVYLGLIHFLLFFLLLLSEVCWERSSRKERKNLIEEINFMIKNALPY